MTSVCPCCGAPLPDLPVGYLKAHVGKGLQEKIIEVVARKPGIGREGIADAIYADRIDGGPLAASAVVGTIICQMNKRLTGTGWSVACGRGRYGYKLVQVAQ